MTSSSSSSSSSSSFAPVLHGDDIRLSEIREGSPMEKSDNVKAEGSGTQQGEGIQAAVRDAWSNLDVCAPKDATDVVVGLSTAGLAFAYCLGKYLKNSARTEEIK